MTAEQNRRQNVLVLLGGQVGAVIFRMIFCMSSAVALVRTPRVLKCVGTAWNPASRIAWKNAATGGAGRLDFLLTLSST